MRRSDSGIAGLRRQLADKVTPHPVCDCGQQIPVRDWRIHRATCPAVQATRRPPRYDHDPRD